MNWHMPDSLDLMMSAKDKCDVEPLPVSTADLHAYPHSLMPPKKKKIPMLRLVCYWHAAHMLAQSQYLLSSINGWPRSF